MKYAMSIAIAHKKSNILVLCGCETWFLMKMQDECFQLIVTM